MQQRGREREFCCGQFWSVRPPAGHSDEYASGGGGDARNNMHQKKKEKLLCVITATEIRYSLRVKVVIYPPKRRRDGSDTLSNRKRVF